MVNTEDEFWKDVVGYGDLFSVSNKGQIFSKRTDKVLKQNPVSKGYNACMTRIGGRKGKCVCKETILSIINGLRYVDVV